VDRAEDSATVETVAATEQVQVDKERMQAYSLQVATEQGAPLRLKVQDCGGQEQFLTLLHNLLGGTRGFVVMFNMEWLLSSVPEEEREAHLHFILRWCRIIKNSSPEAFIFFAGTRKDKVSDVKKHEQISNLLCERFRTFNPLVFEDAMTSNGHGPLYFHPIDNTKGQEDGVLKHLMKAMVRKLMDDKYVQAMVPVLWMALLDWIQGLSVPTVSLAEVAQKCQALGMKHEMELALRFFHDLGALMYIPEMMDLVVIHRQKFFMAPASSIARDWKIHLPNKLIAKIQKADCEQEFEDLRENNILHRSALDVLWEGQDNQPESLNLMIMCNVFVPLATEADLEGDKEVGERFLVPALLDATPPKERHGQATFFLLFATSKQFQSWEKSGSVEMKDVESRSSYPYGIFEGLLAEALQTSQASCGMALKRMEMTSKQGKFSYGNHQFCLTFLEGVGMVEVSMQTPSVRFVLETLEQQAGKLAKALARNIECRSAIPSDGGLRPSYHDFRGTILFVNSVRKAVEQGTPLWAESALLGAEELNTTFSRYMLPKGRKDSYDGFASYRQGGPRFDGELAADLFSLASMEMVKTRGEERELQFFWDAQRLESGLDFQEEFCVALSNSTMGIPIVSHWALERMMKLGDDAKVDNVLLEWILMLVLHRAGRLKRICPVLFGFWDDAAELQSGRARSNFCTNLFQSGKGPESLPKVEHEPTLDRASEMLRKMGVNERVSVLDDLTVHGIVGAICTKNGITAWTLKVRSKRDFFVAVKKEVLTCLTGELAHEQLVTSPAALPVPPAGAPMAAASSISGLQQLMMKCNLQDRVNDAEAWFTQNGCESIGELKEVEMETDFVDALQLLPVKAKLLLKKLAEF